MFRALLIAVLPVVGWAQNEPATNSERVTWVVKSTLGPPSVLGGLFSAGFGTLIDSPKEYGPGWEGFGKRYGMRYTGVGTSNVMEAGIGAFIGEDPRYFRAKQGSGMSGRIGHVVKWTFMAPHRDGELRPAYARYIAIAGNNALSNTWRADSEADAAHFLERTGAGFMSRMAGNAFEEFWPDIKRHVFNKR